MKLVFIFALAFVLTLLGGFLALFAFLIISTFKGAPFVPSRKDRLITISRFTQVVSGDRAADLGSGDGRIVIELARRGAEAHGYEINPFLVWWSRFKIKRAGLESNAFIHWQSFWNENFSNFNIITVFGITYIMKELEEKLKKELPLNARIVSNGFAFPSWKYSRMEDNVYLYELKLNDHIKNG